MASEAGPEGLHIYIDGDACPVRDEVFRVAERHRCGVTVVSNGARGVRLPESGTIRGVIVAEGPDAADDWIAERIRPGQVCVTADIPLASRCLAAGAAALAPNGTIWDAQNIGGALAGREVSRHLRETGLPTRGPAPFGAKQRSRFLQSLDAVIAAATRPAAAPVRAMPDFFA